MVGAFAAFAIPWIARRNDAGPSFGFIAALIAVCAAGATTIFAANWYEALADGADGRRWIEFVGLTSGLWCALGAYHLSESSVRNHLCAALVYWIGIGLALWSASRLIADDYGKDRSSGAPEASMEGSSRRRATQAWVANLGIAAAALVPMMLIAGVPGRVTAIAPILWMVAALLNRAGGRAPDKRFRFVDRLTVVGLIGSACGLLAVGSRSVLIGLVLVGIVSIDAFASRRRGTRRRQASVDERQWEREVWSGARLSVATAGCLIVGCLLLLWMTDLADGWILFFVVPTGLIIGVTFYWRWQGFTLLVLIFAALVWVVRDRSEAPPSSDLLANEQHDSSKIQILALGDSYSSGEGADKFLPDTNTKGANQCRRSAHAYAYEVAESLHAQVTFLACSGALASEFYASGQMRWWKMCDDDDSKDEGRCRDDVAGWRPQLQAARQYSAWKAPVADDLKRLILFSIGGNDMLFGAVGKGCALPGDCSALVNGIVERLPAQLDEKSIDEEEELTGSKSLTANLVEALLQVRAQYPQTPIRVLGYPRLLGTESGVECRSDSVLPLSDGEVTAVRGYIEAVNATVEAAVHNAQKRGTVDGQTPDISFLRSSLDAYGPEGICDADEDEANMVRLEPTEANELFERLNPLNWTHNSLHPKSLGHSKLAAAIRCEVAAAVGGVDNKCAPQALVTVPFGSTESLPQTGPLQECGRLECISYFDSETTDEAVRQVARRLPAFALLIIGGILGSALLDDVRRRRRNDVTGAMGAAQEAADTRASQPRL